MNLSWAIKQDHIFKQNPKPVAPAAPKLSSWGRSCCFLLQAVSCPLASLTIRARGCWALESGGQPWKARRHLLPHTVQLQSLLSQAQMFLCQ